MTTEQKVPNAEKWTEKSVQEMLEEEDFKRRGIPPGPKVVHEGYDLERFLPPEIKF